MLHEFDGISNGEGAGVEPEGNGHRLVEVGSVASSMRGPAISRGPRALRPRAFHMLVQHPCHHRPPWTRDIWLVTNPLPVYADRTGGMRRYFLRATPRGPARNDQGTAGSGVQWHTRDVREKARTRTMVAALSVSGLYLWQAWAFFGMHGFR